MRFRCKNFLQRNIFFRERQAGYAGEELLWCCKQRQADDDGGGITIPATDTSAGLFSPGAVRYQLHDIVKQLNQHNAAPPFRSLSIRNRPDALRSESLKSFKISVETRGSANIYIDFRGV